MTWLLHSLQQQAMAVQVMKDSHAFQIHIALSAAGVSAQQIGRNLMVINLHLANFCRRSLPGIPVQPAAAHASGKLGSHLTVDS